MIATTGTLPRGNSRGISRQARANIITIFSRREYTPGGINKPYPRGTPQQEELALIRDSTLLLLSFRLPKGLRNSWYPERLA